MTELMSAHGFYEVYLYDSGPISVGQVETCSHRHPTLEEARSCARSVDPFDVVWVDAEGYVVYLCKREDEEAA